MNRLVCTNLDAASPAAQAALEPWRNAPRNPGRPVRILFINAFELGFGTTSRNLQRYAEPRPDLEAVHFAVHMPPWLRAVCAETPFKSRWDLHANRMFWGWRRVLHPWLHGSGAGYAPLDAELFDAVHILTQQRSAIIPWWRRSSRQNSPRWVVNVDATLASWDRDYHRRTHAGPLQLRTERGIYHAADAVAGASRWVLESLSRDYSVPAGKQILHRPCVPVADDGRSLGARRAPPPLRLVFVGNDFVRKGGDRLAAWHRARWADRAELHICSAAAPAGLAGRNVFLHGAVPHERLIADLLPTMHLMVIPTREDTFLIAAQEAQALGIPVITSRLCGIPEVVLDGRTGLLCPRDDDGAFIAAVERFLADPSLLAAFSAAAARHAHADLNADTWHNHLLDQLVALAEDRPISLLPRA